MMESIFAVSGIDLVNYTYLRLYGVKRFYPGFGMVNISISVCCVQYAFW